MQTAASAAKVGTPEVYLGGISEESMRLALSLSRLSSEQKGQIGRQLDYHRGGPFSHNVTIGCEFALVVGPEVMRPMSSIVLARWLWENRSLLQGRRVVDMGTGSGLQAMVAVKAGAESVLAVDVSEEACSTAELNVKKLALGRSVVVQQGDLFNGLRCDGAIDFLIFAQPFFGDCPIAGEAITRGMLDPGILVPRCLAEAKKVLQPKGVIVMMAWSFAGGLNDPRTYAHSLGWNHTVVARRTLSSGCQLGAVEVVLLNRIGGDDFVTFGH